MGQFDALTLALEDWFERPLVELPDALRQRVEREFFPVHWEQLAADQRRSVAWQRDYRDDPAAAPDRQFWWDFFQRMDDLRVQIAEWEAAATPTAEELATKENRLAELKHELTRMEAQRRSARGDYYPERKPAPKKKDIPDAESASSVSYIAYPKALQQLVKRLAASPEELAAWIWDGPEAGGIAAYVNANEMDPPQRFSYSYFVGATDYIAPLMGCWFKAIDVEKFEPGDRYILGATLIERWSKQPGLDARAFIRAKIHESRLSDIHPIYGGTRGTFTERHTDWPPLESGLFSLTEVAVIEKEDFDEVIDSDGLPKSDDGASIVPNDEPVVGSKQWRTRNAKLAADARHDKPGGSREKHRRIREIWASGKYSSRDLCAEQECAALNMSFAAARRALTKTPEPSRC